MSSSYLNRFVIAGGSGTRIKYLFPNIDKFLIPVSDIPFYVYIINGLNNLNFNDDSIILNISNRFIKSQIFNNQSVEFLHDKCLKDTAGGFLTGLESLLPINLATNCDSLANVFKKKIFFKNILLNLKIISLTSVKKITSYEKCNFRYGYVFKNDCFVLNLFEKVNLSEYSIFNSGLYVINVKLVKDFFFKNIIFFGNKF
ncbi:hypothetical protein E5P55_00740 [Candidatus Pinguicoccus supinus]|uniref:Nucleotidyl transferase domain-containing protein n=1 Tax=Candidatus Pinguicoccus supinus TaxID=2529394 RepID=A0A7T0FXX1_9BACT|nr:hypothetical protein E5P55_00740 [Candidatus Pinguicoccus supinus]